MALTSKKLNILKGRQQGISSIQAVCSPALFDLFQKYHGQALADLNEQIKRNIIGAAPRDTISAAEVLVESLNRTSD